MDDQDFKDIYGITDKEKQDLINRISQDISLIQDFEIEEDYESLDLIEDMMHDSEESDYE